MPIRNLSVRMDDEMLYKLHYVSEYEGRTASGHALWLIRKSIEEYEKEHGKIVVGGSKQ